MKILLIDNYDSFTYNLYHLLQPLVFSIDVVLNDQLDVEKTTAYDAVVLSPGPGLPADAGAMPEVIHRFHMQIPMFGVCLGMQAMAEYFGGNLKNLDQVLHGIPQQCTVVDPHDPLYKGMPTTFKVGHYHSWIVNEVPDCFRLSAIHSDGWPVSFSHRKYSLSAVQYHPESVMTPLGKTILQNWLYHINAAKFDSQTLVETL